MPVTWNPSDKSSNITLSNGDLTATKTAGDNSHDGSLRANTALIDGDYYEVLFNSSGSPTPNDAEEIAAIANASAPVNNYIGSDANGWSYISVNGQKATNGSGSSFGDTYNTGDRLMVAYKSGKVWFGKNGTWQASGDPANDTNPAFSGLAGTLYPAMGFYDLNAAATGCFTAASQVHSPPSGFQAMDQSVSLVVASSTHAQTANSPALTQVHSLIVANATHAHSASSPSVILVLPDDMEVSLPVRVNVVTATAVVPLFIAQSIESQGAPGAPIQIDVQSISGVASLPIVVDVQPSGIASLPMVVNVHPAATYPNGNFVAIPARWGVAVLVAGVNFSSRCTGQASVEIEEGASRLADFSVHITPTDYDAQSWAGGRVSIDYKVFNDSGTAFNIYRLFTGIVETLRYDPMLEIMSLRCSDGLQDSINAATKEAIDAHLGGGAYSPVMSNTVAKGWQYAQDRISTLPGNLDLDRYGAMRYTEWFGAGSTGAYDDSNIISGSFQIEQERPKSHDDGNQSTTIVINYDYRRPRVKSRMCRFTWRYPFRVSDQIENGYSELTRQMVTDAVAATNWGVPNGPIIFDPIPPSGLITFIGQNGYTTVYRSAPPEIANLLCWGFRASLVKRFGQTITERYKLVVKLNGGSKDESESQTRSTSFDVAFDVNTWEKYPQSAPLITPPIAPDEKFVDVHAPDANIVGDTISRELNDSVVKTLVNQARRNLAQDARLDTVTLGIILQPYMDTTRRVTLNLRGLARVGKVRQVVHRMDFDGGTATSRITVTLTKNFAVGESSDDQIPDFNVNVPAAPTPPAITAQERQALTIGVATLVGPIAEKDLPANVVVIGRDSQPSQVLRLTGPTVEGPSHDPWTSPVIEAKYSVFS